MKRPFYKSLLRGFFLFSGTFTHTAYLSAQSSCADEIINVAEALKWILKPFVKIHPKDSNPREALRPQYTEDVVIYETEKFRIIAKSQPNKHIGAGSLRVSQLTHLRAQELETGDLVLEILDHQAPQRILEKTRKEKKAKKKRRREYLQRKWTERWLGRQMSLGGGSKFILSGAVATWFLQNMIELNEYLDEKTILLKLKRDPLLKREVELLRDSEDNRIASFESLIRISPELSERLRNNPEKKKNLELIYYAQELEKLRAFEEGHSTKGTENLNSAELTKALNSKLFHFAQLRNLLSSKSPQEELNIFGRSSINGYSYFFSKQSETPQSQDSGLKPESFSVALKENKKALIENEVSRQIIATALNRFVAQSPATSSLEDLSMQRVAFLNQSTLAPEYKKTLHEIFQQPQIQEFTRLYQEKKSKKMITLFF